MAVAGTRRKNRYTLTLALALLLAFIAAPGPAPAGDDPDLDLRKEPVPFLDSEDLPERAGPLIELGRGINEGGKLTDGIEIPTGAVWQPALWIYGALRTAVLSTDGDRRTRPNGDVSELRSRLDVFANLQLTGTERIQAHMRPVDKAGRFAGKTLSPSSAKTSYKAGWDDNFETLFFEGDIGELFPRLDPRDQGGWDLGFAAGKFPVELQNGYLVRDEMTAVGLSKNNIQFPGSSGMHVLGLWGFHHVNESGNARDRRDVDLFALSVEGDFPWGLLEVDVGGTVADKRRGNQINGGVGWTGHPGIHNLSAHANFSSHTNQTIDAARGLNVLPNGVEKDYDGTLLVLGYSREIGLRHDLIYATGYWANGYFGRLASNASPPLGPVGLSFAGVGLGAYRPALWPAPLDSLGAAVGVQKFLLEERANVTLEIAHRYDLEKDDPFGNTSGFAVTTRVQYKIAERFMLQLDAFYAVHSDDSGPPQDAETDEDSSAVRLELRIGL